MECPICRSESVTVLKSKELSAKKRVINEYLLQCNDCEHVFRDRITQSKPINCRLIISENDYSKKSNIKLYPDENLKMGDILLTDDGQVKITGLEIEGKRVNNCFVRNIKTIWASSMEIPARFGLSVDLKGKVQSYKIDTERDFEVSTNDIIKIENYIVRVHIIKTDERKLTSGVAKANVIKRVYTRPINLKSFDYDLTDKIYKKTIKEPKY